MESNEKQSISISKKSFITSVTILLILMITAYTLTFILDKGIYVDGVYSIAEGDNLSVLKLFFAPFLQFGSDGSSTLILIIGLIIVIGGVFTALDRSGVMKYMLDRIVVRFKPHKYLLLSLISLFFMIMGSTIGMFEECVPLVPIAVMLSYALGWDAVVGISVSLLSVALGFSSGVFNPFTVGVAQSYSDKLTLFSGFPMRMLTFVIVYAVLLLFLLPYAKKIDKNPELSPVFHEDLKIKSNLNISLDFERDKFKDRALIWFAASMGLMVLFVTLAIFIRSLTDYIMYVIILLYVVAGLGAVILSKMGGREIVKNISAGIIAVLPAVLMIMLAGSIKYILSEGLVLDTIIYKLVNSVSNAPKPIAVLIIYLVILTLNFLIPSGSAKAALIMPVIYPLVDAIGIHHQTAVLAFAYGDGFSNVIYPTNPVLLIALGLTTVSYVKWFRWSVKVQAVILFVTAALLIFADRIVYPV
jgi:uncharacterized ion transporter superfamily protein YfcC